ncbi:MAG: tetratricopeptide repeat protein [Opitutales bacterium]
MPEQPLTDLDPRLQKQVQNARQALAKGNTQYAIDICMDILRRHPECSDVREVLHAARGKKMGSKGTKGLTRFLNKVTAAPFTMKADKEIEKDPIAFMEKAEKMLNQTPSSIPALRALAQAATHAELPKAAVLAYDSATKVAPDDADLKIELGNAHLANDDPEKAVNLTQQILSDNAANEKAQELLRRASVAIGMKKGRMEEEGDYRKGLKSAEEATELEEANRAAHDEETLQRLIDRSMKKVEEEPENINHYRDVANFYKRLHKPHEAIEWIRKARELPSGRGDTTLERQEYELELMGVRQDIEEMRAKVEANPDDADAAKELAEKEHNLHSFRLRNAGELVEKYPNDYGYRYEYGVLLLEDGQNDGAIEQLQRARNNPKVRLDAMLNLGRAFKAKGIHDLAAETLAEAKADITLMNELKKQIIYELALVFEAQDKVKEAIDEYKLIYANDIAFRDVAEKINKFYERGDAKVS